MGARFKDYDSRGPEGGTATMCSLYADDGEGAYLGYVYVTNRSEWHWEADGADPEDPEDEGHGTEDSRREAKAALRRYLKGAGIL